jgi:nitrate/nitrite transport system ATP-binding protein
MHNLLFRDWLASAGIDPEMDLKLSVIPPPQMVANLKAGNILGYCVGEPWNVRAVHEDLGQIAATDADIWPDHPEKVLGVTKDWAAANPKTHRALIKALLRAGQTADQPEYRKNKLAELLSQRTYVGGRSSYFRECLVGPLSYGDGWERAATDLVRFSGPTVNQVGKQEMLWVLCQMARWGQCPFPRNYAATIAAVIQRGPFADALTELDREPMQDDDMIQSLPEELAFIAAEPRAYLEKLQYSSGLSFEEDEEEHSQPSNAATAAVGI